MKRFLANVTLATLLAAGMWAGVVTQSHAMPANPFQQQFTQPNGKQFTGTLQGDEWSNWLTTSQGDILLRDADGFYKYAVLKNGRVQASAARYKTDNRPSGALNKDDMKLALQHHQGPLTNMSKAPVKTEGLLSPNGTVTNFSQKTLIILVNFSNATMKYADSAWYNYLFYTPGNSVDNYYTEISGGKFQFVPASETYGTANDGIVHVTLGYPHPNTGSNTGSANQMVVHDALVAADPYINYASYDTNGDGYLSDSELHIVTVLAGYEASYGDGSMPSVWGHHWNLWGASATTLDGKVLGDYGHSGGYVQIGESHGSHMATIGILSHELGHSLGLPDLYDTDNTSRGVGMSSLMGYGSWGYVSGSFQGAQPTHMDAWSKVYVGFATPTVVGSGTSSYSLNGTGTVNPYNVLKVPTSNASQYFLVENREFAGYDYSLAGWFSRPGLAIWHIDESVINANMAGNTVEADETHKGVDLEEADEAALGYSLLDRNITGQWYDSYWSASRFPTFGNTSTPNSKLYDGTATNITISTGSVPSNTMNVTVTK